MLNTIWIISNDSSMKEISMHTRVKNVLIFFCFQLILTELILSCCAMTEKLTKFEVTSFFLQVILNYYQV